MDRRLSENLNKIIAEKYPELEGKIKEHFGISTAPAPGQMTQVSLNPNVSIDDNINNLVKVINSPETSPDDKIKALASYNMIVKKMEQK